MLNGTIKISSVSCNKEEDFVEITLLDNNSRLEVITIKMSFEQFSLASIGNRQVKCDYEINQSNKIGKIKESKFIYIDYPISNSYASIDKQKEEVSEIVKQYEYDGWKGSIDSAFNTRQMGGKFKILMERYV